MNLIKIKNRAPEFFVELTVIVAGILLALAVDDWRETRNNQEIAG